MLARLDRLAETGTGPADHAAARLVAGEFEQFLELVEREGGAARAGLFLARRLGAEGDVAADDLAPVRALARADAWLRTGSDAAAGVPVADLDPAQRAGWTAEQWARAEAAGLLALAPPPDSSHPETAAPAPGLTPPTAKPISRSGRTSSAAKRQRIREGTMPSNDQSRPTAPVRAAALI
jgi:hypothetical protein